MGGLKTGIADGIRIFKPKSLKLAISLAWMRDEQLVRHRKDTRPFNKSTVNFSSPTKIQAASTMKMLPWVEMQKRRAQGLCFYCDEKLTLGHRCKGPQFLLLECSNEVSDEEEIESSM